MYDQDIETPIELLSSRFRYHRDMMTNFTQGSEKYVQHEKMMIRFGNAIGYIREFEGEN